MMTHEEREIYIHDLLDSREENVEELAFCYLKSGEENAFHKAEMDYNIFVSKVIESHQILGYKKNDSFFEKREADDNSKK